METYHMQRADRQLKDEKELVQMIKDGKYMVIAMSREDMPYVVTLSYGYDEAHHCLYFHSASKGLKIDYLNVNSKVCGTIIEDGGYQMGECAHKYRSLVITGSMTVVTDLDEKKHGLEVLFNHLEDQPQVVKDRLMTNDGIYQKIGILKLEIQQMVGKMGQ